MSKIDKNEIRKETTTVEFLYTKKDFKKLGMSDEFNVIVGDIRHFIKKSADSTKRFIKGYASTDDADRVDDIITMEALRKAKSQLLQPGSQTVFFNHDRNQPIGKTVGTWLDQKGLIVKILISAAKSVDDIWTQIKEGVLNSLSIGGRFKKVQVERDGDGNITSFKVLELELFEVSVVGIPANPKASIFEVIEKSFKGLTLNKENKMSKKEEKELEDAKAKAEVEAKAKVEAEEKAKTEAAAKEVSAVVTKEVVKGMIDEAISPVVKGMEGITNILAELSKKIVEQPKKEENKEVEVPEWAKKITSTLEGLQKDLTKNPVRKGAVQVEEEEGEEVEIDEAPKKALVDHNDPATVAFVKHVMNNKDEYEKLTVGEKEKAGAVYFVLLDNGTRKGKK